MLGHNSTYIRNMPDIWSCSSQLVLFCENGMRVLLTWRLTTLPMPCAMVERSHVLSACRWAREAEVYARVRGAGFPRHVQCQHRGLHGPENAQLPSHDRCGNRGQDCCHRSRGAAHSRTDTPGLFREVSFPLDSSPWLISVIRLHDCVGTSPGNLREASFASQC